MSDPQPYHISFIRKIIRQIVKHLFLPVMYLLFDIDVIGKENVPPRGEPYLIAFNHVSLIEPPILLAFWPYLPEAVAGHIVWERGAQGWLMMLYGAIPVKRGEFDREVLQTIEAVLHAGLPLAIAPEGGRSHHAGMMRAKAGIAYVMNHVDVPVIPVGFEGTLPEALRRAVRGHRGHITMRIGEAFRLPPITGSGQARRASRQANADFVMRKIADLLPPEYHGVYAEDAPESLS